MVATMAGAFVFALVIPPVRNYFDLPASTDATTLAAIGVGAIAAGLLELGWRLTGWSRSVEPELTD